MTACLNILLPAPLAIQYIPQSEINAYPGTLTQNP